MTEQEQKLRESYKKQGMSDKDINGLIAMYRQNGTLNAETPIEVEKHHSTDLMGAMQAVFDKITGNGTEVVDRQGQIKSDDRSNFGRKADQMLQSNNNPVGYVYRTVMPAATVAIPYAAVTKPILTGAAILGPAFGGKSVDTVSKLATGKSWADNVKNYTGEELAPLSNPGIWIGGARVPTRVRNSIYNNVTPFGYGRSISSLSRRAELTNAAKDFFLNPKMYKNMEPGKNPKWFKNIGFENTDKESKAVTLLRNEAYRKALKLKPNTRNINGKEQALYLDNKDAAGIGTVSYNLDYIKDLGVRPRVTLFNNNKVYDHVGYNGGQVHLRDGVLPDRSIGWIMTDQWDIQPLNDSRSLLPRLTKFAEKHPNWLTNKFRNFEVVKNVNGDPFMLKQRFHFNEIPVIREYPK